MFKEHEFWIVCWIAKFRMLFVFILEIASTSKPFSFLCHFLPHPKLHVLLNCLIITWATVLNLGKHDLGECLLKKTLLGTCHRSRAGEMWVGGGGCVRVSSRTAQLRLSKKTPANRRVNSQNRRQSFPEEQRKKCCILDNYYYDWVLSWSSCRKFCPSSATPGSHEILFLFSVLPAFLPQPFSWQLHFSIPVPKPAPSLHCIPFLLPVTLERHSHKTKDPSLCRDTVWNPPHWHGTLACRTRTSCGKHSLSTWK